MNIKDGTRGSMQCIIDAVELDIDGRADWCCMFVDFDVCNFSPSCFLIDQQESFKTKYAFASLYGYCVVNLGYHL